MKRVISFFLALTLSICLSACGQPSNGQIADGSGTTWQEQYDLGVRYLSEGNYEEAIIAFTAAIEIDPKQAPAYVGRGDAYVLSGKTEENLAAAQADYEKAIELDESNVDAYLGLANVYIQYEDYEKAKAVLEKGYEKTKSEELKNRLNDLPKGILFEQRKNYQLFDSLAAEEQQYLKSVVDLIMQNNKEQLIDVTRERNGDEYSSYCTIYNDMKIELTKYWNGDILYDAGLEIEIRSESGTGYFCSISVATDLSRFAVSENATLAEYYIYGYGPCENWQWNGTVEGTDQRLVLDKNNCGYYSETHSSGQVLNNLREGTTSEQETYYNVENGTYTEYLYCEIAVEYSEGFQQKSVNNRYDIKKNEWSTSEYGANSSIRSAITSHGYSSEKLWW